MRPWMVFDCETDSFDGSPVTPFIWGWKKSDGEEGLAWSTLEFIEVLREFDGIALAHNGGKFDTVLLAEYFEPGEIKLINGRVAEVKIGAAAVRDSFLIIPAPLSASGLKDDFDYGILDRNKKHLRKKHAREIEKYLVQDCRALYELVERFYSLYGQRLTQAGAALVEWEKMGGMVRRWGGAHDAHFRQFYFGGRCEAFQKGALGDGWDYFDIKSAYPYAMKHEHPASHLRDYWMHTNIKKITPQSFARVMAANHGCLPMRGEHSTEYPHHDEPREYFATGWEIIAGLETGTLKIFSAMIWRPKDLETLAPYVEKFYADKLNAEKSGDKVGRLMAKIFLNSLYGKYGSAAGDYKRFALVEAGARCSCKDRDEEKHFERCPWTLHAEIGDLDIVQRPDPGQFYDVALAASVTGFARAYLFRQMHAVNLNMRDAKINRKKEFNRVGVAYMDTDSLICRGDKIKKLFDIGENLGQWEHVCTMDEFHVAGKKLYAGRDRATGEWVTAHKGFSALDTSHEDVIKVARGEAFIETEDGLEEGLRIMRSAPSINVTGRQSFINRKMRKT